mgnify:CR=1 FL=1
MRLFVSQVNSHKEFEKLMKKHFPSFVKVNSKVKKTIDMKYIVIYETNDTREQVVVKDYNDLINKIKIININNWSLMSVKRKF